MIDMERSICAIRRLKQRGRAEPRGGRGECAVYIGRPKDHDFTIDDPNV